MRSVVSAIQDTIPFSMFNQGLAGKIFSNVKATGAKVVMKNNRPEVVIVPPEEYVREKEELENYNVSKGTIRIPYGKIDKELIQKIARWCWDTDHHA